MNELLKAKAEKVPEETNKGKAIQLIVFRQGNEEFGLHISQIKEVVKTPPITPLPQTPNYIRGVANIRGNVIAMVDLKAKLSGQGMAGALEDYGYSLVVSSEELHMGILVKDLPVTLTVYESDLGDPNTLFQDEVDHSFINGIVKLPKRLLLYIDILRVMEMKDITMPETT